MVQGMNVVWDHLHGDVRHQLLEDVTLRYEVSLAVDLHQHSQPADELGSQQDVAICTNFDSY